MAQKASPSRQEVVMLSTLTPGYPSTSRLHQSSSAFVPRRSLILILMSLRVGNKNLKEGEEKRVWLANYYNLLPIKLARTRKVNNSQINWGDPNQS